MTKVNEIKTVMDLKEAISKKAFYKTKAMRRPSRLAPNTEIDENKSIKWNKEEVIRINEENMKVYKENEDKILEEMILERETTINVFAEENNLSPKKVEVLFWHAWSESHDSGMMSVVNKLEELIDLFEEVNNV